jgi:predicted DNA-binding ribbon-helix-helix protein
VPLQLAFSPINTDAFFMRTTVTIDDDVYAKVKQIAEESGHTFGHIISELARKGLGAQAQCNPETVIPVFRVMIGAAIIPRNSAAATA